jgi:hypothetical protein
MNQDVLGLTHAVEELRKNSLIKQMRKKTMVLFPGVGAWSGIRNKIADGLVDLAEHVRVQSSRLNGQAHLSK